MRNINIRTEIEILNRSRPLGPLVAQMLYTESLTKQKEMREVKENKIPSNLCYTKLARIAVLITILTHEGGGLWEPSQNYLKLLT